MPKFRKKPVEVEAWQFTGKDLDETGAYPSFLLQAIASQVVRPSVEQRRSKENNVPILEIATLEGVMTAHPGDWIIQGVKGELYPCKPDVFEETYEPVETVIHKGYQPEENTG